MKNKPLLSKPHTFFQQKIVHCTGRIFEIENALYSITFHQLNFLSEVKRSQNNSKNLWFNFSQVGEHCSLREKEHVDLDSDQGVTYLREHLNWAQKLPLELQKKGRKKKKYLKKIITYDS